MSIALVADDNVLVGAVIIDIAASMVAVSVCLCSSVVLPICFNTPAVVVNHAMEQTVARDSITDSIEIELPADIVDDIEQRAAAAGIDPDDDGRIQDLVLDYIRVDIDAVTPGGDRVVDAISQPAD